MIDSNAFYDDYQLPIPNQLPSKKRLKELVEEVSKEVEIATIKHNTLLNKYRKGNIPKFTNRPIDPTIKYRIYTFLIKRKFKDETMKYSTIAIDNEGAISNVETMFGIEIGDLYYLAPISVSKPDYPNVLLNGEEEK